MSDNETTEWKVSWFPPDQPDQTKTYTVEGKARDRYAAAEELGHYPILSSRILIATDWEIVKNSSQEPS